MPTTERTAWQQQLPHRHLELLRTVIPAAIHRAQFRSAAAHEAYHDTDGDRYVYGIGMGRGAQKELAAQLADDPDFHTRTLPQSRRALLLLGDQLLYLHRVGARMPINATRIRLDYLPAPRQVLLHTASVRRFDPPALLELDTEPDGPADGHDLARHLADQPGETLLAACYSSTPHAVGRISLAPAKLVDGHYLQLIAPEALQHRRQPERRPAAAAAASRFDTGIRPRTTARLRPAPPRQNGS